MTKNILKFHPQKVIDLFKRLSFGVVVLEVANHCMEEGFDFGVQYANNSFVLMCGFSNDTSGTHDINEHFSDNIEGWRQFFSDCVMQKDGNAFHAQLPGNERGIYHVKSQSLEAYVLVEIQDVTSFVENERKLEVDIAEANRQKAQCEAFFAAVGDAIEIIDPEFRVIFENKIAKEFNGSRLGEICYETRQRSSVCKRCPAVKAFEFGTIQREGDVHNTEGGLRYIDTVASPVMDENGAVTAVIKVLRDVTEMKHVEQARMRLIKDQQKAMAEVKKLSGLLTICSKCKQIKANDDWHELESYLRGHSEVELDKVICPDCK